MGTQFTQPARGQRDQPGAEDLIAWMEDFESTHGLRVGFTIELQTTKAGYDLLVRCESWKPTLGRPKGTQDAAVAHYPSRRSKDLLALLMGLVVRLDAQEEAAHALDRLYASP